LQSEAIFDQNRLDCTTATLDDYIFDEWKHHLKAEVLAKVVGDFRGWDASAENYDAAFQKLLQALQAEAGK